MKKSMIVVFITIIIVLGIGIILYGNNQKLNKISNKDSVFSTDTHGLPETKPTETIELKDGDTYDLKASIVKKIINGQTIKMLAYNGSIPGPTIKVPQDATITVNLKNETDVETTLHSHGLRLKNAFDGVPNITQMLIKPGDSFTYQLTFPDAGVYWYHPHFRQDYAQELGLYGNFLVTPKDPTYWNTVDKEVPLFLDDISFENGRIASFYKKSANHTLMGRFGNIMLINGETDYTIPVKKGEVIRFYLTNSANVRPFNFTINGVRMKLVGGDSGAYEKEEWVDAVTIAPSERVIVEALFDTTGEFLIQNKTPDKTTILGKVIVDGLSVRNDPSINQPDVNFNTLLSNQDTIKSINPFRIYFNKELDKKINLSVDLNENMERMLGNNTNDGHMMSGGNMMEATPKDGIEWENSMDMMSVAPDIEMVKWKIIDANTNKKNMDIDWKFKVGDKVKIRIFNDPKSMHPMQHPIHFHGQRFLVIDKNGEKQKNLVWKDTVLVPAGQFVDILLDVSNPGDWMAHCHISEHAEDGMMFIFKVLN